MMGAVSGNAECLDFDDAETFQRFKSLVHDAELDDLVQRIEAGYSETSPSEGIHYLYRCAEISGNTKLACRPKRPEEQGDPDDTIKTLIETRGEGGYIVRRALERQGPPKWSALRPAGGQLRQHRGDHAQGTPAAAQPRAQPGRAP